ncbi:unnamed protein product [Ilex paraguariensis]|uniref:AAA+ ATPase domain-containing protein n=1 Tax=Ilex paraguariensis TaxID=185542 RepID=A0ABC8TG87_9AQUA
MNKRCVSWWCPNLIILYRLGKEAKKRTPEVTNLQQNGMFNTISNPAPLSGILSMSSGSFVAFGTRKSDMMKVMGALNEANVHLIAIHGMGGVGKTTLVKEIGKKAKEEKLFDEVVMAVVSQNIDIMKMQDQIADMLGLQFTQRSVPGRASQLRDRLRNVNKKLIILDDVWDGFKVENIGIPFGNDDHKVCKVLITTRRREVCNSPAMGMGNQLEKIITLNVLSVEESWDLFKMNAGEAVDSPRLTMVAKDVANECRGLPIALVTVGRAMRGKVDSEEWKEAVLELRISAPANIDGVDKNVFKSLKLSYNYLRNDEAKSCFLLCSLFPEDGNILIKDLVRYGIGLRIFKDVDNVQEARRRAKVVVNRLIDSCLLLQGHKEEFVKLHDVVRDVAIWIGSEKYFVRAGQNLKEWPNVERHYTGISLMWNDIDSLPPVWKSPNLQMLLLQKNLQLLWPTEFFSGLEALKVLDLSHTRVNLSKVLGINHLAGLRTLVLDDMTVPVDTKFLGHMKTLEVLSLKNSVLPSPPLELRELSKLRLLDMSATRHNSLIPADVMLGLSRLEELYMFNTFINEEPKPAVEVAVVNSFPHLSALEISITDSRILPQDFIFPDVKNFRIKMGNGGGFGNTECLGLFDLDANMPWWKRSLKNLLKRTSDLKTNNIRNMKNIFPYLFFDGDVLNLAELLVVEECREFEYLINRDEKMEIAIPLHEEERNPLQLFPNLEELILYGLDTLKGICHGAIPSSWEIMSKLKVLDVSYCCQMSSLGFHINLLQRLQFLEKLDLLDCSALQHVFEGQSDDGQVAVDEGNELSLREISLIDLPSLNQICNCPGRIVHLHNLRHLDIIKCRRLKNLFQSSVAQTLQKLEILKVYECEEIEEIIAVESEEQKVAEKIVFPCLKILELRDLTNLKCFCMGGIHFEWPSLNRLYVGRCPNMKTFVAAAATNRTQSNPKLKKIIVDGYVSVAEEGESVDLNIVIQRAMLYGLKK